MNERLNFAPVADAPQDDPVQDEAFREEADLEPVTASRLPSPARRTLVWLLTNRFLTRTRNPVVWQLVLDYEDELRERLADLYLELVIDRDLEVAFKRQVLDEDAAVLLRRDRPLPRDASFLLIFLRREHAFTDGTDTPVVVSHSQIADFLRPFRTSGDSDEARFDRRVAAAIKAVGELGLLSQDPDADFLYTVSPVVVPLVSVEVLIRMEQIYLSATALNTPEIDNAAGSAALSDSNESEPG